MQENKDSQKKRQMSPEIKDIKVMVGKKIPKEEAKTLDKSKMGVGVVHPPAEQEVEGQHLIVDPFLCPWCFAVVYVSDDTTAYHWYMCPSCGHYFRY
jgi:hypothetical protein